MAVGDYFPPSESETGWRWTPDADVDQTSLDIECRRQDLVHGGHSWGLAIVHRGWLVREHYSFNVATTTRFDVWSATKSVTSLAWGILLDNEGERGGVSLDTPIYDLIPVASSRVPSDPRRRLITVGQVLSMTSGIPGERNGIYGMQSPTDCGVFEFAFGWTQNRFGAMTEHLAFDPGSAWDYSDAAYCHLSLAFETVAGRSLRDYSRDRLFSPIGIQNPSWEDQGGRGFIGPYTNAHTGLHLSAREFARLGYLAMHGGTWDGVHVVPADWIHRATSCSQPFNPSYGYGWWTNQNGTYVPGMPEDLFALSGFGGNRCWVLPSSDLVVARVGTGPGGWDDRLLLPEIVRAVSGR